MAGLNRFEPTTPIEGRPARTYGMDRVVDVGGEFSRFGKRLMSAFEPELQDRARKQAADAAGAAQIVRDADGNWTRPETPKGGRVYMEAFDKLMDTRYLQRVQDDLDEDLDGLARTHRMSPESFRSAAVGYAEGTLEKVDPKFRGAIDDYVVRSVSERYRGLADETHKRVMGNEIESTRLQIKVNEGRALKLLSQTGGGPDAVRLAMETLDRNKPLYEGLVSLGAINPQAAEAMQTLGFIATHDEAEKAESIPGAVAIASNIKSYSDQELDYLVHSGQSPDIPLDGSKFGWKRAAIEAEVPSKDLRVQLGRDAADELNRRGQERAALAAAQRDADEKKDREQQLSTFGQILTELKKKNYDPVQGFNEGQVAAFETGLAQRGNVRERMDTGAGRQQELRFIGETGYIPQGLKEFVEGQVQSGNLSRITAFVNNLRNTTSGRGRYAVGEVFYQGLSENTKRAIQMDALGRKLGWPTPNVQELVRKVAVGEGVLTPNEAKGQFKNYDNQRAGALVGAFKLQDQKGAWGAVSSNPMITRDFDNALPMFMLMFPGDSRRAMEETAKAIGSAYRPNSMFEGGFAPAVFERSGISNYAINQLPQVTNQSVNPTGARAGQTTNDGRSRILLSPMSSNQQAGYGKYQLTFLSQNGRIVGRQTVDFDAQFKSGGIPQPPQPAQPGSPRVAGGSPYALVWDRSGKLIGYRDRAWRTKNKDRLWQGKTNANGQPVR